MMKEFSIKEKEQIVNMIESGVTNSSLSAKTGLTKREVNTLRGNFMIMRSEVADYKRSQRDYLIDQDRKDSDWNRNIDSKQEALDAALGTKRLGLNKGEKVDNYVEVLKQEIAAKEANKKGGKKPEAKKKTAKKSTKKSKK